MNDFRKFVNKQYNLKFSESDYWDMYKWSVETPETMNDFYNAAWDWGGVIGDKGQQPVSCRSRLPPEVHMQPVNS